MRPLANTTRLLVILPLLGGSLIADPTPQENVSFIVETTNGTWVADWNGVEHRIYTFQWSLDLVNWSYAPFVEFGDGVHSWGGTTSTDKFFFRLHYLDDPEVNSLEEAKLKSFDGQGLPLEWKILNGLTPFDGTGINGPNGDLDGDGIPNNQDSRPNDNTMGAISITITTPANGTSIN